MSNFNLRKAVQRGTQQGVNDSFAALFRAQAPFVWRVLRRYGVPEEELEDACQEVFVVVHRKAETFAHRSSVRTWLYGIARRIASRHTRAMRGRPTVVGGQTEKLREEVAAEPELDLDRRRQLAWLQDALAQLDEQKREVFILYEVELLTVAEVAEVVGCNESTALYRLQAARERLRVTLSRRELTSVTLATPAGRQAR
jgi:RNA polymerase sigma-70 factor (ECF subfamily)